MHAARIALAIAAVLAPAPLIAASGGGGGSLPSASAPQFDPAAEYRSGVAALESQQFKVAERHFTRVVGAAPRDASAHYMLGMAKAGGKNYKSAAKSFAQAVKLDGDHHRARQQLGIAYAQIGESEKASAELAELKRRAAACGECADASQIAGAVSALEAAIGAGPQAQLRQGSLLFAGAATGDTRYLDAIGLINEQRFDDAIAALKAAQASFGPHPDVLTYLGFANRKLGRFDVAEDYYRQALAAAPEHLGATEYYGELKLERGDMAGAKAMLARLDSLCSFGCAEAEELRRWIDAARQQPS